MNNSTYHRLFSELKKYYTEVIIVILAIAAISGAMLSLGHILKSLIDSGIGKNDINALNSSILHMICAVLVLGISSFLRSYYINTISNKVVSNIRLNTYQALLNKPNSYFDSMKISDITSRFSHDLSLVGDIITNLLSFTIRNSFTIIGGVFMMFFQNAKLSLIVMISLPITIIFVKLIGKKVRLYAKELQEKKSSIEELIGESLTNIRIVYAFNIKDYTLDKFLSASQEADLLTKRYLKIRASFFATSIFIITSLLLMVLWIGGMDVVEGVTSPGNITSFIFYATLTAFSIGGVAEVFGDLQKSFAGAERIFELQDNVTPDLIRAPKFIKTGSQLIGHDDNDGSKTTNLSIHIKNFSYPSRPDVEVIRSIDLDIKQGEFIGIAGPSGGGKSTFIQMIIGIYQSPNCTILINNSKIDFQNLHKKISYVPQDPFLFSTSIRENITLGRDFGSLDEVIEITGLDSVLNLLPQNIDTYVGEKGMQLSGGQKQRIALARSLYGKPDILLLDEGTSALDIESEFSILEKTRKFMKDKIIIVVAHRLHSIKDADRIILIHNGSVISEGSHKILLKKSLLYKHLVSVSEA